MYRLTILLTSLFILIFNGCTQRNTELVVENRDRFLERANYDFQIIDIKGAKITIYGTYISSPTIRVGVNAYLKKVPNYEIRLATQDVAKICTPYLMEAKSFYRPVIGFYEYQINDYKEKTND